ncbi:dihydrodipicolinate reductase [Novosphingobium sp. TH158]|uniref:NAD(P)H-dependent amine dehydrogenase family protein n=1 Tax=Novosphingobium sp. TH158 TaxID=2067455 RepID=UPI000C7C2507|nr:dihydrodipicolinate reductase [Novosphingobium sp. TH158]PLK26161.1 dihydrodipicolinate reductase [Novosphingobium sp. TH158]
MADGTKYRVIQWATGNVGTRAMRAVVEHPDMELVGLWVSNPEKAGLDAARLVERDVGYKGSCPDTGVIATSSVAEIVAQPADCVLYMRQGTNIDELCQILASGKNVVTTRGDFHDPRSMDPEVRERIEEACAAGNSSVYSTGSSPGFITEAMLLPMVSMSRRLDCVTIDEYADMTSRNSPDLIFNVMGYGVSVGQFDQRKVDYVKHDFAASLAQVAQAIGIEIDEWRAFGELSAANNTVEIAAGTIEAGTVGAQRITIEGVKDGKARLRFRANWYCTADVEHSDWNLRESGWKVAVEGDTPMEVNITFPVDRETYPTVTPGFTAHRAVNSIPAVCAAAPGIRTTAEMEQVLARFS